MDCVLVFIPKWYPSNIRFFDKSDSREEYDTLEVYAHVEDLNPPFFLQLAMTCRTQCSYCVGGDGCVLKNSRGSILFSNQ